MKPYVFGGVGFVNLTPEPYTFEKGSICVPPSGSVASLSPEGAVLINGDPVSDRARRDAESGCYFIVPADVFPHWDISPKFAAKPKPEPVLKGYRVRLLALRTPGTPEHGFHTFNEATFKTLPEGITLGDHTDLIWFLARLQPLVTDVNGYDEGDCIAACVLSNFRNISSECKLFFRVEEVFEA